jgi:hypothetical protein
MGKENEDIVDIFFNAIHDYVVVQSVLDPESPVLDTFRHNLAGMLEEMLKDKDTFRRLLKAMGRQDKRLDN